VFACHQVSPTSPRHAVPDDGPPSSHRNINKLGRIESSPGRFHRSSSTLPTARRPSPLAYAIDALTAAALSVRRRHGHPDDAVSTLIAVVTQGRLLAPIPPG